MTWPNQSAEDYLAALNDPDHRARLRAIAALQQLREERAVAPLIVLLAADENARVRAAAAQTLGKRGDPRAIYPLIAALSDAADDVREHAVVALERLGDPRAASAIFPLINDPSASVRYDATRAAAKLGGAGAIEPLMRALRDPDHNPGGLPTGDPSVNAALAIIGEPARAPLLAALQDASAMVRARAAASLYGLHDDEVTAALRGAERDPDPDVSRAARSSLETIENGIAFNRAMGLLANVSAAHTAPNAPEPPQPSAPVSDTQPLPVNWPGLMSQWNTDLLADDEIRANLPPDAIASGWLGYPGASEEQLAALEERLGVALPPSYRAFLAYSNGWRATGPFIPAIWSTEQVEWFAVRNQDTIDAWLDGERYTGREPDPVPDEEYLDYGGAHGSAEGAMRSEYLQTALEISDREEAGTAIYVLNPQIVTPAGEWEAWFFAHWVPGATRYRSFWELMVAEHASFLALRDGAR